MSYQRFYNSVSPSSVPTGSWAAFQVPPSRYAWPESEIKRMSRVMRMTYRADPADMRLARGVDFEPGNPGTVAEIVECAKERRRLGHKDFTLYVDEPYAAQTGVVRALQEAHCYFRLWIARWDNDPSSRPVLDGVDAWAKQYKNTAGYDLNVIYGHTDFSRP